MRILLVAVLLSVLAFSVGAQSASFLLNTASPPSDFSKYYGFAKIDYWSVNAKAQVSHIVVLARSPYYAGSKLWWASDSAFPLDPSFTDLASGHNALTLSYLDGSGNPSKSFTLEFFRSGTGSQGVRMKDSAGNSCYSSGADSQGVVYLRGEETVSGTRLSFEQIAYDDLSTLSSKEFYGDKCGVKVVLLDEKITAFLFDEYALTAAAKRLDVGLVPKSQPGTKFIDAFQPDATYYGDYRLWSAWPRDYPSANPSALRITITDPSVDSRTVLLTLGAKSGSLEFENQSGVAPRVKLKMAGVECGSGVMQKDAAGFFSANKPSGGVAGGRNEYYWDACGVKLVLSFLSGNSYAVSQLMLDEHRLSEYFGAPFAAQQGIPDVFGLLLINGKPLDPSLASQSIVLPTGTTAIEIVTRNRNDRGFVGFRSVAYRGENLKGQWMFPSTDTQLSGEKLTLSRIEVSQEPGFVSVADFARANGTMELSLTPADFDGPNAVSQEYPEEEKTVLISFETDSSACGSLLECLARIDVSLVRGLFALFVR